MKELQFFLGLAIMPGTNLEQGQDVRPCETEARLVIVAKEALGSQGGNTHGWTGCWAG